LRLLCCDKATVATLQGVVSAFQVYVKLRRLNEVTLEPEVQAQGEKGAGNEHYLMR
jgi:hypothetical protein